MQIYNFSPTFLCEPENLEEFKERVYERVRQIHITRFPYNKFLYPDYKDAIEKEE